MSMYDIMLRNTLPIMCLCWQHPWLQCVPGHSLEKFFVSVCVCVCVSGICVIFLYLFHLCNEARAGLPLESLAA